MSEALSENAERLLARVVSLGSEYPGGEVPDEDLWRAAEFDYEAYVEAAQELVGWGLVEIHTSDFATLKATLEGTERTRER